MAMRSILVVDDEYGIAEVLNAILSDEGYRVATAINGRQGLTRLAEMTPDIVLLDYMMPILDGAGMLSAMAAEPIYRAIPVIMMSALDEPQIIDRCAGYVAFLRKPFKSAAVVNVVSRVLGLKPSKQPDRPVGSPHS